MKRIIVVLAVMLMGLFLFAEGQGENGGASASAAGSLDMKGRVLRYIAWWNPAPEEEMWKLKVAHLEEKFNFKLDNINSGDWGSHHNDLVASITAGAPIGEYVYVDQSFFAGWVAEKLLLPVEGYGIDYSQPYYHQQKREGFTFLGHEYSIKDQFIEPSVGWWFNKSMLEREGLEDVYELQREGKWTWDKMLEMAKACTKDLDGNGTIDQWGFGEDPLHVAALAFIASNGGNIVENAEYVMNSPQVLEALQFYQDLNLKHKVVAMRPEESEWNWAYYQFGQGKIAFLPFHYWASGSQFGEPEDELGWALFPAGPKGEMTSGYYPNNTVVVPAGTKDVEKVLNIWDQIWKPDPEFTDPDSDPFSWLYSRFYDLESVEETQYMMSIGGKFVPFTHEIFGFKSAWEGIPGEILKGEKTPKVALEEVSPIFEAKLKELLGN